ncbi:ABC transporter permease [Phytomonospora sp. NPDC050363]|uniref:ABC transporter permease n=1 Tax=Phytomonospora sp. NPDC050363 TaxID=3155642 RepID=UPI0033FCF8BC
MYAYVARRLLLAIPILITASMLAFTLVDLSGDPIADLILRLQQSTADGSVPQATIDAERERLYLDRSMPERYWLWLTGIGGNGDIGLLQGEWGPSVRAENHDIGGEIGSRFLVTFRLVLIAVFMAIGLAIVTGVISAVRQYRKTDYVLTFVGFLALAMPTFWLAALIKETGIWVNKRVGSTLFYTIGATSPDTRDLSFAENAGDVAGHLILPTLALMLTGYAAASRYQRSAMLDVLNSDYIRLARAKGLRNGVVMRRHALRTALIPIATFAPLAIAGAFSGVVIVEFIFNWRGLGTYLLESIVNNDSYAVMGWLVLAGTLVVCANLVADLLYAALDPRIRYA